MTDEFDTPSGVERRKYRRAGIRLEAVLRGSTPDRDARIEVVNFSVGGFLCLIDRPLELMTKLGVHFQFPPFGDNDARDVTAVGLVVRCEATEGPKFRLGACFIDIEPDSREHVRNYVAWYHETHSTDEAEVGSQAV